MPLFLNGFRKRCNFCRGSSAEKFIFDSTSVWLYFIMRYFTHIIIIGILTLIGCGKGIEPEPERQPEGFGGTIFFSGQWPQNVTRTHIVAFKNPLNTPNDFNAFNLGYVSLEIPFGVSEFNYSTLDSAIFPINTRLQAGTFSYIGVAQQTTVNLTLNRADWFVIGIYTLPGNDSIPGSVIVPPGEYIDNINIYCDFSSPPPQPPGNEL
jgi:hypothetical protein